MNEDIEILTSAARTSTVTTDFENKTFRGAKFVVDVTAISGSAEITVKIEGKDSVSEKTFTILESSAINATGTTVLTIHPGISDVANEKASDILPRNVKVTVTHANADSITYSVSALMVL